MLDLKNLLDIKYFNGTYANYKMELGAPGRDTVPITVDSGEYLYIGLYKNIKNIYFDFSSPAATPTTLTLEYFNGTDWSTIEAYDETNGFSRNGLIQWSELSDQKEIEIDTVTKHWIRISTAAAYPATFNFIGLIFSSDSDLILENPFILDENLLMGESNHLKAHVAVRNEIVQTYSNKGIRKVSRDLKYETLSFWDMLNIQEFRQGAVFLALAKIYFNLSDREDDVWLKKSKEYRKRYQSQINLYYNSIDTNDDGVTNASERVRRSTTKIISR